MCILLLSAIGELVDNVGVANAVYRLPPPGAKDKEKWTLKKQNSSLARMLAPL